MVCSAGSVTAGVIALGLVTIAYAGGHIAALEGRVPSRLWWLALSIASLTSVLALVRIIVFLTRWGNTQGGLSWQEAGISPVGLSFFALALIGYVHDCYRGVVQPERSWWKVLLFGLFLPYVSAGPIPRSSQVLPQFQSAMVLQAENFSYGLRLMLWGVFKKLVIADAFARIVERLGGDPLSAPAFGLLLSCYIYAFQLYIDFTAYSDIAIGAARVFGIALPPNFRRPYAAASPSEFWTRWHISLSSWLRDHLYFPLGGSRVARWRHFLNLLIVFLISGLWHGAGLTFLLWGLFHAVWLIGSEIVTKPLGILLRAIGADRFPRLCRLAGVVLTFHMVTASWVLFRAQSLGEAGVVFRRLGQGFVEGISAPAKVFTPSGFLHLLDSVHWNVWIFAAVMGAIIGVELAEWARSSEHIRSRILGAAWWWRWPAYYALSLAVLVFGQFDNHAFIYAGF